MKMRACMTSPRERDGLRSHFGSSQEFINCAPSVFSHGGRRSVNALETSPSFRTVILTFLALSVVHSATWQHAVFFFFLQTKEVGPGIAEMSDVTSEAAAAGMFQNPANPTTGAMHLAQDVGFKTVTCPCCSWSQSSL